MAELAQFLAKRRRAPALTRLLVLQPTPYCNIACTYCYLPDRDDRRRMPDNVLDAVGARILASPHAAPDVSVVWHAGEPLVLPAAWYANAIARLEVAAGRTLRHGLQTNGIGLDAAWTRLIAAHDIRVGISLDGPAAWHDARRRTRRGGSTHALTMAGVEAMQRADLPFHVITVLSAAHLADPDSLVDFYVAHGIRDVGFNVEEIEGANATSTLLEDANEARFRLFLRRFLARMQSAPGLIRLREAEDAEALLLRAPFGVGSDQVAPLAIVSVDVAGRVSSFSPELLGQRSERHGDFTFGNILDESFETIAARIEGSALAAEIAAGVEACRAGCAFHALCGGGAPANKLAEHGRFDGAETRFCRFTRQIVLEETLAVLEARLDRRESGALPCMTE